MITQDQLQCVLSWRKCQRGLGLAGTKMRNRSAKWRIQIRQGSAIHQQVMMARVTNLCTSRSHAHALQTEDHRKRWWHNSTVLWRDDIQLSTFRCGCLFYLLRYQ